MAHRDDSLRFYEPDNRDGHAAVEVNGKVYLWGGSNYASRYPASRVEVFDVQTGMWASSTTTGTPPTAVVDCAYTAIGNTIYTYGGWTGSGECSDALHELDLTIMSWRQLNPSKGPIKKKGCRMVPYNQHMLVVYGGDEGTYNSTCGELHVYTLKQGESV